MCGIVGYTGPKDVGDVILKGLKRLEYRGYDSAGVCVKTDEDIYIQKKKGRIDDLSEDKVPEHDAGIGHTRWATHGKPSDRNAHPFLDCNEEIAIVHNGIIDNFTLIKEELIEKGHEFHSETDSEVIVHLIEEKYEGDFLEAFKKSIQEIEGSYAVVALHRRSNELFVARNESPLVIGVGSDENFVASDVPALLDYTKDVKYLQDGDTAHISRGEIEIWDEEDNPVKRNTKRIDWDVEDAEKSGYEHYMLKEIYEQPKAIHESLLGRLTKFEEIDFSQYEIESVQFVACGTSSHAGYVGRYIFEKLAKIPCTVEVSSEYRYTSQSDSTP
ncbi:MAG: glutamine--fructose-6-phosphate transaminase (isomerizing), partial [Candidatus Aenigmatarchaeota archaeon]